MTDITQQILDLTGITAEMLVEFKERVDNFVLEYNKELDDRGHEFSVMLGLAFALNDASERIVVSCRDYVLGCGEIFGEP